MDAHPEAQPRILIVDDQELNIQVLQRILRDAGYSHIRSTTDPCAAVALFVECHPDLVLLDLQMPVLDGFGVLARLVELHVRNLLQTRRLHVMMPLTQNEQLDGKVRERTRELEEAQIEIVERLAALTHDRPYRKAWPLDAVIAEIRRGRGGHFDPQLVDAFLGCRPERAAPTPSRGIRRTHHATARVQA